MFKKIVVFFLVFAFILSGVTPLAPTKKADAFLFEVAAALSIMQSTRDLSRGQESGNPPTVWLGPAFDARVNQPEVGLPDEGGWRKIVFPYDLYFSVKIGYIVKFWNGKSTDYLSFGGDVVKLKKGEAIYVKMTSALQELLDQVGKPIVNNPVSLPPTVSQSPPQVTQPPVQQPIQPPTNNQLVHPSDATDITNLVVDYLPSCNGWKYRGKVVRVFVSEGIRVDYWDHKTQKTGQANKGDVIETGEFTWYK